MTSLLAGYGKWWFLTASHSHSLSIFSYSRKQKIKRHLRRLQYKAPVGLVTQFRQVVRWQQLFHTQNVLGRGYNDNKTQTRALRVRKLRRGRNVNWSDPGFESGFPDQFWSDFLSDRSQNVVDLSPCRLIKQIRKIGVAPHPLKNQDANKSSVVNRSSVSVYQISLWRIAPKNFLGKIRQSENLLVKRLLCM